jgi:uncharacterized protein (TIGR00266 family)
MASLQYDIRHRPDFAAVHIRLQPGQKLLAEPSALAWKDAHIALKSSARGGIMKSLGRLVSGESLFLNTYSAESQGGEVVLAPGPMGDMEHYRLDGSVGLVLQAGAFVASEETVLLKARWEGLRGLFGGEGLVLQHASGTGDIFFNTWGGILGVELEDEWLVDTGCVVAFEDTLRYSVEPAPHKKGLGGFLKGMAFGGEGLVCRFSGRGKLWIQSRSAYPVALFLHPFRSVKAKSQSGGSDE